ncbi:GNAT family N-acetyltransferase [Bacillus sp. AFS015802]|uniref:GNAT family N-acetyltransferase n=1 Tax=Bacillus sp. AFS015802 TaxID=2033486 RepID=UPI000BF338E6|nr:GNAT family protein [Bacillus sp. AFS015802]PFA66459.1 GNAT family N-acetyltransferase [Bacillus sp. AFS015802]
MKRLLTGTRIYLSGFQEEDITAIRVWNQNEEVQRLLDALPHKPKSEEEIKKWMENPGDNAFRFAIRLKDDGRIIGFVELDGILWTHRVGWIAISIGDGEAWGKGYGREAMECLLAYAFHELNLYRLQLTVFSYNERAIRLYESLGFMKEGNYRQFLQRDGTRYDMLLYGLLADEWKCSGKEG